jgi:hypothetical protein
VYHHRISRYRFGIIQRQTALCYRQSASSRTPQKYNQNQRLQAPVFALIKTLQFGAASPSLLVCGGSDGGGSPHWRLTAAPISSLATTNSPALTSNTDLSNSAASASTPFSEWRSFSISLRAGRISPRSSLSTSCASVAGDDDDGGGSSSCRITTRLNIVSCSSMMMAST